MESIMSKIPVHNSEASLLVRARELRDGELDAVSGGVGILRIPTIHPAKVELGSLKTTL
jgi:hypothetical protein